MADATTLTQPAPAAPVAPPAPVQNPLTVILTLKSEQDYQELNAVLSQFNALPPDQNPVVKALDAIATVHFARFVFLENNTKFGIITTYDGDFDTYIRDFSDKIGDIFDLIHSHMADCPPLPVKEHPEEFLAYIRAHNIEPVSFYSAYPTLKVLDIRSDL